MIGLLLILVIFSAINTLSGECAKLSGGSISSPQTFTGPNYFQQNIHCKGTYIADTLLDATDGSSTGYKTGFQVQDVNNQRCSEVRFTQNADLVKSTALILFKRDSSFGPNLSVNLTADNVGFCTAAYRTTNLSNIDIITKGNLEGSDHTFTGINTFSGTSTTIGNASTVIPLTIKGGVPYIDFRANGVDIANGTFSGYVTPRIVFGDKNGTGFGYIGSRVIDATNSITEIYTAIGGKYTTMGIRVTSSANYGYAPSRNSATKTDYQDNEIITVKDLKALGMW